MFVVMMGTVTGVVWLVDSFNERVLAFVFVMFWALILWSKRK